jgi:predicted negative regulator of RcsB-dependent stress response
MAKKKIKEEIKKPDILIKTIEFTIKFIRTNLKLCIVGVVIFFIIGIAAYGYSLHQQKKDERAQLTLFQGVRSFEEYSLNGREEDLNKAEDIFQKIVNEKQGKTYKIAKLYLGKIYYIKGKNEEAKQIYREILNNSSEVVLKTLAEKALQHIEKK